MFLENVLSFLQKAVEKTIQVLRVPVMVAAAVAFLRKVNVGKVNDEFVFHSLVNWQPSKGKYGQDFWLVGTLVDGFGAKIVLRGDLIEGISFAAHKTDKLLVLILATGKFINAIGS